MYGVTVLDFGGLFLFRADSELVLTAWLQFKLGARNVLLWAFECISCVSQMTYGQVCALSPVVCHLGQVISLIFHFCTLHNMDKSDTLHEAAGRIT